jgi:GNAT superfamily N-acetyltransferase
MPLDIQYRDARTLPREAVLALYQSVDWSSANKPDQLMAALAGSHTVITAWDGDRLVGLGNTISDGALVVYFPHLVVHPDYQRRGIGREIVRRLMDRYAGFHQHAILADGDAIAFYEKCGFTHPKHIRAMWIYAGGDHGE